MGIKDIFNKVVNEVKVVKGEETKDKVYTNQNTFPDEETAIHEFERSKRKLFDINQWTDLDGLNSTFQLFDNRGRRTSANMPEIGYYVRIILPASPIENWVKISNINIDSDLAEFVVHPSEKPSELTDEEEVVQHFFIKEASSTFRVERRGNTIIGYEIGKDEGINNQGEEAGDRALLNTLIAEGGWAGVQALQWDKVTRYYVHLEETEPKE